jgi:DNA-binding LytR/AlgR family response regulator
LNVVTDNSNFITCIVAPSGIKNTLLSYLAMQQHERIALKGNDKNAIQVLLVMNDRQQMTNFTALVDRLSHYSIEVIGITGPGMQLAAESINNPVKSNRFLVKRGMEQFLVDEADIVYFVFTNKLIFLVNKDGEKYIAVEKSIADIADKLNPALFFRANRKFIVHIKYLKHFKSVKKSKVHITMTVPSADMIIVSQLRAPIFKNWVKGITTPYEGPKLKAIPGRDSL